MRVLDLFSGIGGFSLGLERAGMDTIAFCEIDPFCRKVLAKNFPGVPCHDDITTRDFREGEADVVCGGFPCQDISLAGDGAGLAGDRSGLWRELLRAIRLVRPRYAIVENVAALLGRGMGTVLGDLAEIGNDAEWDCIPAAAVGAPHRRDRVWIVAHACRPERGAINRSCGRVQRANGVSQGQEGPSRFEPDGEALADTDRCGWSARDWHLSPAGHGHSTPAGCGDVVCDADGTRLAKWQGISRDDVKKFAATVGADWWSVEPDVGRVAHGVPARVDRLRGLGNAVVPQIPEIIGRAIMTMTHSSPVETL